MNNTNLELDPMMPSPLGSNLDITRLQLFLLDQTCTPGDGKSDGDIEGKYS